MMKIKKFTALLLVIGMTLSLVACENRTRTADGLSLNKEASVNVWYCDDSYTDYLNRVAADFNKANDLVTINIMKVNSDKYLDYIYNESVHAGNVADVYMLSSDNMQEAYMLGLTRENDTYGNKYTSRKYSNTALTACSYNGVLYGYPLSFNTAFMVYNEKLASDVSTFTELSRVVDTYTVDGNNDVERIAAWDASDDFLNYAFVGAYINAGGNDYADGSVMELSEKGIIDSMKAFSKLKSTFGIDRTTITEDDCVNQFKEGKLLYTIVDSDRIKEINESGISYNVCPIPSIVSGLESRTMSTTTMMMVNPFSANHEVAQAVANAIAYDEAADLTAMTGHMSARSDVSDSKHKKALKNIINVYSNSSIKARFMGGEELYTRYSIMIHNVWDGADAQKSYDAFSAVVLKMPQ